MLCSQCHIPDIAHSSDDGIIHVYRKHKNYLNYNKAIIISMSGERGGRGRGKQKRNTWPFESINMVHMVSV